MRQIICLVKLVVVLLLINVSKGFSQQLKLGKNPSAVIRSAVLELESTNQGLLFPRLADTVGINLFSPPDGMVIYLTPVKQLYVRANNRWQVLTSGTIDTSNIDNFSNKVRTRISATAPIAYNSTTGIISIPQASSTTAGYLSAADWTTFNNKLSSAPGWSKTGDAGTTPGTNFIGTTDAQDLIFKTNSTERWRIENSTGDIKIGDATSGTFKATKELVMRQDGDTYGSSILRLRNRNAENGAIYETTDPNTTLVDFIFKTAINQRNIRYEARSSYSLVGVPAFHIGGSNPDLPALAVGDNYSAFNSNLKVGNYTTPTEALDVAGNVKFSGALMPNNSAGTSGYFLKSNGTNAAPTWVSLSYLADPGANGIMARTALNTTTSRTITGTSNKITITNGDGVSGNPIIDISATYAGQSSITTLGTITTGTWNGTKISETYGGTDQTSYTKGDILYASASNTLSKLSIGATGERLVVLNGVPTWESPATYQASPSDPTSNNSTTAKMMGLAGSITPTTSGKIMIIISGDVNNNTSNSGALIQIRYGTGSAPSNGSTTMSGIAAGTALRMVSNHANNRMPFTCNAIVTGLTVGTAYWIDVSLATITSGTAAIKGISISVAEL